MNIYDEAIKAYELCIHTPTEEHGVILLATLRALPQQPEWEATNTLNCQQSLEILNNTNAIPSGMAGLIQEEIERISCDSQH